MPTKPTDPRGLALTTASSEAAAHFDDAIEAYLEYRKTAGEHLKQALQADPDFALAHCLKGYFLMLFGTTATHEGARKALVAGRANEERLTWREKAHLGALDAWLAGDLSGANRIWTDILIEHPHDILALRLQHFNAFWMGDSRSLRDTVAGVLGAWNSALPGYSNLLGMLAFGLEETGDYATAESFGRRAVEANPNDLWAVHAVAHVLEMQGRLRDGLAWLDQPAGTWSDRNPFKDHLWWHTALFPLEMGDYERVLSLYDAEVAVDETGFYLDVQNAASLLVRLELLGVDVGDRWQALGEIAAQRVEDHVLAFTDIHFAMSLAAAGRSEDLARQISSLEAFGAGEGHTQAVARRTTLPLIEAVAAYRQGDHDRAVELLLETRTRWPEVGASHAQRDIFTQILVASAMAAGRWSLARNLLSERVVLRPNSQGNWLHYAKALEALGESASAASAHARATAVAPAARG
jgi:tetratricopeptide (TPR) repeat protein